MTYTGAVKNDGIKAVSFITSVELATPYLAVKLSAGNTVNLATAELGIIGITQWDYPTEANDHIAVKSTWYTLATAGDTVWIGDELEVGTGGKLIVADEGVVVATCLSVAEDGDYIEVLLK